MSETAVCASCAHDLLPGLAICFDCELANATPPATPRLVRRYRWNEPVRDPARLAAVLGTLCPKIAKDELAWLAEGRGNEILAELTAAQDERLAALLRGVAPNVVALVDAPPASTGFRFATGGRVREKLAATVVVGGLAIGFGVPLVPFAAVVTTAILIGRMPRFIARRLTLARAESDALLGPLAEEVVASARAARLGVSAPPVAASFRAGLGHAGEIASTLRRGGAHIEHAEVGAADAELGRLVRAFGRLALTAQRTLPAAPPSESYRTQGRGSEAAPARLADVAQKLDPLRATATRAAVAPKEGMAPLVVSLKQLTQSCASMLANEV